MKTAIKILGNIIISFASPLFFMLTKLNKIFNAIQNGYYSEGYTGYYDYPVKNFGDILKHIYNQEHLIETFIILPFCLLVLMLTPLQLYQDLKFEKGRKLSFLRKWFILSIPFLIFNLLVFGRYMYDSTSKDVFQILVLLPTSFTLYIIILKYILIDFWTEKTHK